MGNEDVMAFKKEKYMKWTEKVGPTTLEVHFFYEVHKRIGSIEWKVVL